MKIVQIVIGLLLSGNLLSAQDATEIPAIQAVIQNAYIDGIHNQGSTDAIRKGFHPGFELLIKKSKRAARKTADLFMDRIS
jgi:hypothetical protein